MAALRWIGFAAGVMLSVATVIGVMKTFIVPRRSWSLIPAFIGRNGFRVFHGTAARLPSFDLADRLLGFLAPTVVIGVLTSFLGCFVVAFALLLLPWGEVTIADALKESGSSIFTLGFVSTDASIPIALDILGGATGMIFVTLTIGYLPALYSEVKKREALVKQLEGWTGTPSWGPEILARLTLAGALDELNDLYRSWDTWSAQVADTHMKYPVLTHFRAPRAGNHWLVALLAVMDAAALDIVLRPEVDHAAARLLLNQGTNCLRSVAYPMRRVDATSDGCGIDEAAFAAGVDRLTSAGFCGTEPPPGAWQRFSALRSGYGPLAQQLVYWTIAAPAPWSGERAGFSALVAQPDSPPEWHIG